MLYLVLLLQLFYVSLVDPHHEHFETCAQTFLSIRQTCTLMIECPWIPKVNVQCQLPGGGGGAKSIYICCPILNPAAAQNTNRGTVRPQNQPNQQFQRLQQFQTQNSFNPFANVQQAGRFTNTQPFILSNPGGGAFGPFRKPVGLPAGVDPTKFVFILPPNKNQERRNPHPNNSQSVISNVGSRSNVPDTISPPRNQPFECGKRRKRALVTFSDFFGSFIVYSDPIVNVQSNPDVQSGHEIALTKSWPWIVRLLERQGTFTSFLCAGSLINDQYAITSASCMSNRRRTILVRVGEQDFERLDGVVEDVPLESQFIHPEYDRISAYNDIALVKLGRKLIFNDRLGAICLPWGSKAKEPLGRNLFVVGAASKNYLGVPTSTAVQKQLIQFEPLICDSSYANYLTNFSEMYPRSFAESLVICAGHVSQVRSKDGDCMGDPGGPLMRYDGGSDSYTLVGVISRGDRCDNRLPSSSIPVTNARTLKWIKEIAF